MSQQYLNHCEQTFFVITTIILFKWTFIRRNTAFFDKFWSVCGDVGLPSWWCLEHIAWVRCSIKISA